MFFALFLTFLSVSYDIHNVLRSQCSVVEHEHLFWWNTSNLHSKGWENYLVFVFWMFHQRNKQNKVVMKTTHKGDKYLDFKHVFLHGDFEMHFPPHCVEQKKLVLCRRSVQHGLSESLLTLSFPPFVSSLFELQINPKMALKRSIWIQGHWIELLFSFLSSVSWEHIKIWS